MSMVVPREDSMTELPRDRLPGFVDLQVNGFGGVDFSDPALTREAAEHAFAGLLGRGTAAFLPTVITSPIEVYRENLPLLAELASSDAYARRVLGLHLEGPFISSVPGAVGAHDPRYVRAPDVTLLEELLSLANGQVRLLTVAAELPGVAALVHTAVAKGATVSIGHSLYDTTALDRLREAGAVALTHMGNGLPNLLPRHPNPIWAGLSHDGYTAMIIADGHHLPVEVLRTAVRAKGVDRLIVVSDASPVAGLPPGAYDVLGNHAILEPSGRLFNPEKQCLVGSASTMLDCMNVIAGLGLLGLDDMLRVGFLNPLRLIGVDPSAVRSDASVAYEQGRFTC
jgi:N-acetylglucosamine-6-phosphate deacetylase